MGEFTGIDMAGNRRKEEHPSRRRPQYDSTGSSPGYRKAQKGSLSKKWQLGLNSGRGLSTGWKKQALESTKMC